MKYIWRNLNKLKYYLYLSHYDLIYNLACPHWNRFSIDNLRVFRNCFVSRFNKIVEFLFVKMISHLLLVSQIQL